MVDPPDRPTAVLTAEKTRHDLRDSQEAMKKAKIMIVDDEPTNIRVVRKYLELAGYRNLVATSRATEALDLIQQERPDVVLLDIMMPQVSGFEILEELRASESGGLIPVLVLTAATDRETRNRALDLGATDCLTKPVEQHDLIPRVRNALIVKAHHDHLRNNAELLAREVRERTAELTYTRLEVIHCLARAAEYRDKDTGKHINRVGHYVGIIARQLGLGADIVELMEHASLLHDVGKIGISDSILLKPGKLTPEEFALMQTHCVLGKKVFERLSDDEWNQFKRHVDIGARIMSGTQSPLLTMAARIAITHHEKWDGTGYPLALAGEGIPIEGRITAVADVFDALSSRRPYKAAFPLDKCFEIMEKERGKHFDPAVLDVFFACKDDIVSVQIDLADTE